ncbi:MAG: hypothetical protein M1814_005297 [Vezdaea aestivalis]|nr:MAG: hypothetical protein M1814_005297 [Vezdaea aestivalis]
MGGGGEKVPGQYMGWWGSFGTGPQKGVTTYAISSNRQRPLAGAFHAAIFNTWRRFKGQVLYIAPPMAIAYVTMQWAIKRKDTEKRQTAIIISTRKRDERKKEDRTNRSHLEFGQELTNAKLSRGLVPINVDYTLENYS